MSAGEVPAIDEARLPYELKRAVEAEGFAVELLGPGSMRVHPEGERLRVTDTEGVELGIVPLYRLREFDPERLRLYAEAALGSFPVGLADQLAEAINASEAVAWAPPDRDWVGVQVGDVRVVAVHRSLVVDGWPEEDR
ncbi:MAG: hypothetical protein KDA94_16630 [Acidimicrobiales bacterium]|nr:hypothetical protein [Acidimicrobiales bacterium]